MKSAVALQDETMPVPLFQNIDGPKSRYLVFTSAGDHANLNLWLRGSRNFDLWVSYYGETKDRYKDHVDFYISRKGGKFPGLHYIYQHWGDIVNHYRAIFVLDDDIIVDGSAISRLFEIREQYDLWLLQPAFHPKGRISHAITRVNPLTFLRYTNFVEVTCPLFRKDKLDGFMQVYDPVLIGYGVDWWYMDVLAPGIEQKVAIVDEVSCVNPHNWAKGGRREIDRLQNSRTRIGHWKTIREQHNIRSGRCGTMQFGAIKRPLSFFSIGSAITTEAAMRAAYECARIIGKLRNRPCQ